jgi:hypothetical protein
MLPDFPEAKERALRLLLKWVQDQVPILTPLLAGVGHFRVHEGKLPKDPRLDKREDGKPFGQIEYELTLKREDMKRVDIPLIQQKLLDLAKHIGESQTKHLLEVVSLAADDAGNVVNARGEFTAEKFLEIFERVDMDFDHKTLEPTPGWSFVMHPDMAKEMIPKIQQWERDPQFRADHERIIQSKREAWRDREARRKLVD